MLVRNGLKYNCNKLILIYNKINNYVINHLQLYGIMKKY